MADIHDIEKRLWEAADEQDPAAGCAEYRSARHIVGAPRTRGREYGSP